MITTQLQPPEGGDRDYIVHSWGRALERGRWERMRGHWVLLLGDADYVRIDGVIYSINGDPGTPTLPFGIRWPVNQFSNAHLDSLAREQFQLRGECDD